MGLAHHGDAEELAFMRRFMDQMNGTARREYPSGRMGAEDDGSMSYAVFADPHYQTVVIRFGKPVEWIGLGIEDVDALIQKLEEKKMELRGITV